MCSRPRVSKLRVNSGVTPGPVVCRACLYVPWIACASLRPTSIPATIYNQIVVCSSAAIPNPISVEGETLAGPPRADAGAAGAAPGPPGARVAVGARDRDIITDLRIASTGLE